VAWETPSASILSRFERSNSNAIVKLWFAHTHLLRRSAACAFPKDSLGTR
jgi:hypothetical protein